MLTSLPVSTMLARTVGRRALTSRVASSPSRKFLTTSAAPKKRTWKGAAVRWGLAGAGLYYYNTTDIFAEQEEGMAPTHLPTYERHRQYQD